MQSTGIERGVLTGEDVCEAVLCSVVLSLGHFV